MANIFNKEALEALDDNIEAEEMARIASPKLKIVLGAMIAMVAVAAYWCAFGTINYKVMAQGIVFPFEGEELKVDFSEYAREYGERTDGDAKYIYDGVILNTEVYRKKVNGKETDVIAIYRQSPLYEPAKFKNQLVTYPIALLSSGKTEETKDDKGVVKGGNSKRNDAGWIIGKRKILDYIMSKGVAKSLLYETMYEWCGLINGDKDQQYKLRRKIHVYFKELVIQGTIKEWKNEKKGTALYSVHWILSRKKRESKTDSA